MSEDKKSAIKMVTDVVGTVEFKGVKEGWWIDEVEAGTIGEIRAIYNSEEAEPYKCFVVEWDNGEWGMGGSRTELVDPSKVHPTIFHNTQWDTTLEKYMQEKREIEERAELKRLKAKYEEGLNHV